VNAQILIVEDDPDDRAIVARILKPHYELEFAEDAQEARGKLIGTPPDLLLCDVYMPGETGIELAESILTTRRGDIAVVMVTGADDELLVERALGLGAYGYLVKPYRAGDLLITVNNALRRRRLELGAHARERRLADDVISKSIESRRARQLLRRTEKTAERSFLEVIHRLTVAVEGRDQITEHLSQMGAYCEVIARRLELPEEMCDSIALAGQMHDIGMIAVPEEIVLKPGPLTESERTLVETHTDIGHELLQGTGSAPLKLAESIAWTHHENFDGSGYPRMLSGDEIPIEGRVAAAADVFDALTHDRPYRQAMPAESAVEVMTDARGSRFDPEVLDALMSELSSVERNLS
jgi:cyclic di-GMP phosphodiesterase